MFRHPRPPGDVTLRDLIQDWQAQHQREHAAFYRAHEDKHGQIERALDRAEQTIRETAKIHETAHAREHEMAQMAIDRAASASETRFASVNEFRQTLTDQAAGFATKEGLSGQVNAIIDRLTSTEKALALNAERMNTMASLGPRLSVIETMLAQQSGRDHGVGLTWGVLVTVAGVALALGAFLHTVLK